MLGKLLELSVVTADTGAAWMLFQQLGFAEATAGDVWRHSYGVVCCRGLSIGLHAAGDEVLSLCFVRPDVAALHRELDTLGIDIDGARLGSDVFNELSLREPGGLLLRVLEARSFSPPPDIPATTALGRFRAISLPCADLSAAHEFWTRLGAEVKDSEDPWRGFVVGGVPVAYHQRSSFREPLLLFDTEGKADAGRLRNAGLAAGRPVAALHDHEHQLLRGPEGLALLLV